MRLLATFLLFYSATIYAAEKFIEIEIKAARLSNCSQERPCSIVVKKNNDNYYVKVSSSSLITDYGVLKYLTGSVTYYTFDLDGNPLGTKRTT